VYKRQTYGVYLANTGTSWISVSDERQKDIIEPIENALTKVNTLRAVIGKYKHDEEGVRRSFLIAQDVQAVFPEAVESQNNEEALLGLSYTDIIPLLVAAIKEQKIINDDLEARVTQLENN
jgi:long-subunit acyl-CoA synthetase (AMP-forming)